MSLLFCCPSCGADLRVNPASASLVSCPGCGEPIRVPRSAHPREAATDGPALPLPVRDRVTRGLQLLTLSAWVFVSAAACVAASFLLRVFVGPRLIEEYPAWVPPVQVALAGWWFVLACGGCGLRCRGYLLCRPAAARYSLAPWATAAAVGAGLASVGVATMVPAVVGRPLLVLPPGGAALLLVGLSAGSAGVLLEFAFLTVLNRLLWETDGWKTAEQTGRYAIAFVCGVLAVMGTLCLGVVALALTTGGRDANTDPAGVSAPAKLVAAGVILAVCGIGGWLTWRFVRLLNLTRHAVTQPEPSPPPVPSG